MIWLTDWLHIIIQIIFSSLYSLVDHIRPKTSHRLWKRCDSAWGSPVIGNHFWYTIPVSWTQCQCYQSLCLTLGDYKPIFFYIISQNIIWADNVIISGPSRTHTITEIQFILDLSSRINLLSECGDFCSHLRSTHDIYIWESRLVVIFLKCGLYIYLDIVYIGFEQRNRK